MVESVKNEEHDMLIKGISVLLKPFTHKSTGFVKLTKTFEVKIQKNMEINDKIFIMTAFTDVDFRNSKFINCTFKNCSFDRVNFRGADLGQTTGIKQEDLNVSEGNEQTILPPGLYRPQHWFEKTTIAEYIQRNPAPFEIFLNKKNQLDIKYL